MHVYTLPTWVPLPSPPLPSPPFPLQLLIHLGHAFIITDAPKLSAASDRDIYKFTSHSAPVAAKAMANHKEELLMLKQPWWKKIHIEEKTDEEIEEVYDYKILW